MDRLTGECRLATPEHVDEKIKNLADAVNMFIEEPSPENFDYVVTLVDEVVGQKEYPKDTKDALTKVMTPFWQAVNAAKGPRR